MPVAIRPYSNTPFGVSPFQERLDEGEQQVGLLMTAVCDVAGMTARREAGSGSPISAITPSCASTTTSTR
jgi:hypothetical protein